jgi:CRISPR-associated endonuclease Cas3-HD
MFYAHSPDKKKAADAQSYESHIRGVIGRAEVAAMELCKYARLDGELLLKAVKQAAEFHDLGKLDEANQKVLSGEKKAKGLPRQHTDAGTAIFLDEKNLSLVCAAIIQAHHIGYSDFVQLRNEGLGFFRDKNISEHVDKTLPELLHIHRSLINDSRLKNTDKIQGDRSIFFRLALSCLADADHTDTAVHYGDYRETGKTTELKPGERLKKLDEYVAFLKTQGDPMDPKLVLRNEIYHACRDAHTGANINSCDSPVGSGKTTAVMAHLLTQAKERGLRRIIVVLPTINIIHQSVETYRKALVFPDENAEDVVAELHHRADFQAPESRYLTALWRAPIIVTTAVTFFETLASNSPSTLRRLHELPGSAIFVDESHAALPAKLLPLAWRWIRLYSGEWSCYWVLASGSLNRFWEIEEINNHEEYDVPEIVPAKVRKKAYQNEERRIDYQYNPDPMGVEELASWITQFPGPRLVILNTVQNAAVMADYFAQNFGRNTVEHLSTALIAGDREETLKKIKKRLENRSDDDWTFIATSCVEAGVDLSFKTGFRELGSLVSLLQAGGRVNREGRYSGAEIWTFKIAEGGLLIKHPGLKDSAYILETYLESKIPIVPELSTRSIAEEIRLHGDSSEFLKLLNYEGQNSFPSVEQTFKVINTDTRLTVVKNDIIKKIENHEKIDWQEIQKNSVQIWKYKLDKSHIKEILPGIYGWSLPYNDFLGYMAGVLPVDKFSSFLGGYII